MCFGLFAIAQEVYAGEIISVVIVNSCSFRLYLRRCIGFLLLSFFCGVRGIGASPNTNSPITKVVDVLNANAANGNFGRPVRISGVLTCYVPLSQLCFVQDDTAGVYVLPPAWPNDISPGDVLTVEGICASGRFSPIVQSASMRRTGERRKVVPKPISIEELNSGRHDAQWVQLQGVVQSYRYGDGVCSLQLWTGDCSATAMIFNARPLSNIVDAVVNVQGVAGTTYYQDRLTGFAVFLQNSDDLHLMTAPPPAFDLPMRKLRDLTWYSRDGGMDRRVLVQGIVTVVWPGQALFIQDDTGAIRASCSAELEKVAPGDAVQLAGFVHGYGSTPKIEEGVLRKRSAGKVPEPTVVTVRELLGRTPLGQYVAVEGVVARKGISEAGTTYIAVDSGNESVTGVVKQDALTDVALNSKVRLVGAWSSPPAELRNQLGAVLWMESKAAATVLARPVLSGPAKSKTSLFVGTSALALVFAIWMAWRARQSQSRLARQEEVGGFRLAELEREVHRLNEGRERLGRDLHDRIIQAIYAVGLNLDDCAQTLRTEPKLETRLRAAMKEINGVIAELRNMILGLETNAIQPREFRTALKSLALALGTHESNRIRLDIQEDALMTLTPGQATELVYIAREALSNSIRHGGAETTTFGLELRDDKIRFSIEDDGRGFSAKSAEGKGFGLRNMAKRAEALGAIFQLKSEEGQGTRVLLDIPRQKPHFSTK